MECKLGYVNFRRVSDTRRAFRPAFRVTGTSDDCYSSILEVIVIGLGTPRSARENFGCTWEHLGALAASLGAPATSLGAPATSLGAPPITVEQFGKRKTSLGTLLVRLEITATTSVNNGSGLPGYCPGLEPDRMVQSGLLPGK